MQTSLDAQQKRASPMATSWTCVVGRIAAATRRRSRHSSVNGDAPWCPGAGFQPFTLRAHIRSGAGHCSCSRTRCIGRRGAGSQWRGESLGFSEGYYCQSERWQRHSRGGSWRGWRGYDRCCCGVAVAVVIVARVTRSCAAAETNECGGAGGCRAAGSHRGIQPGSALSNISRAPGKRVGGAPSGACCCCCCCCCCSRSSSCYTCCRRWEHPGQSCSSGSSCECGGGGITCGGLHWGGRRKRKFASHA